MKNWKDGDGKTINHQEFLEWINNECRNQFNSSTEYELIVGVDSHLHGATYRFVTVVCLYRKGRGGFYYYTISEQGRKEFKGTYPVRVKARMFHETTLAIEVATEIEEKTGKVPVVHIDASPANG